MSDGPGTDEAKKCPRCGLPISRPLGGGECPACLFGEALAGLDQTNVNEAPGEAQWVGDYELLEEIGRGGMGVMYKARQHGLDRIVAVKMLLLGEFADAEARRKLLREAKVAARLSHRNIITIHEVGEDNGRSFFAMEYVAGRNLSEITRDGLLPLATATRYVEQLARAVHYAHQNGIVHRDIKPANVLISLDDEPKLGDFGLTKSLQDHSQTIESAGSPNFMAPEQADSKLGRTGPHSDIFGLGGILYYLLTGRPPFLGESLSETLHAVLEEEPVSPRVLRPGLPVDLETICLKCLDKNPSNRYMSALAVAEELSRWRRHEPILARPASVVQRGVKWVRRRPLVAALSLTALALLVLGASGIAWQWQRAETARELAERDAYIAEMKQLSIARNTDRTSLSSRSSQSIYKRHTGSAGWIDSDGRPFLARRRRGTAEFRQTASRRFAG
jgi:serine/threonine protein kinase